MEESASPVVFKPETIRGNKVGICRIVRSSLFRSIFLARMLRNGLRTVGFDESVVMVRPVESSVNQESVSSVARARRRMLPSSPKPVFLQNGVTHPLDSRHRPVLPMNGKTPVIDPTVYIATNATVSGDVQIATGSAVWYGSIVKGDSNSISIGTESHIQDRSVVSSVKSTDSGLPGSVFIGNNVVVGYGSVLTGCRVDDNCHIGSCCRILEGAHLETNSSLASGSVVEQGKTIPAGEVWLLSLS